MPLKFVDDSKELLFMLGLLIIFTLMEIKA
jgi:hypothetical protein